MTYRIPDNKHFSDLKQDNIIRFDQAYLSMNGQNKLASLSNKKADKIKVNFIHPTNIKEVTIENNYFNISMKAKNLIINQKIGSSVAVVMCNDKFLLIKIRRKDDTVHYEFPRGFAKNDEKLKDTAIRELAEETNLTDIKSVANLGVIMPDSGLINIKINLILIKLNSANNIKLQKSKKISDYIWSSKRDMFAAIKEGKIIDSYTIAGFIKSYMN